MNRSLVAVEYEAPLAMVVLDRPHVLNAYNSRLLSDLEMKLQEVIDNDNVDVIIITGRGNKSFCVGADIDWLEDIDPAEARELSLKGHQICNLIENNAKVVIAAVNGYALGGGMEIALACDLRLASTRARFGQPEVGLGMIPAFDGTQRLPRLIGIGRAKELLLTGDIIDAEKAFEMGLVNQVVTPRDLLRESRELAKKITRQSSRSVCLIKDAIKYGCDKSDENGSEFETDAFSSCFDNEDSLKRIREFREELKH